MFILLGPCQLCNYAENFEVGASLDGVAHTDRKRVSDREKISSTPSGTKLEFPLWGDWSLHSDPRGRIPPKPGTQIVWFIE